VSKHNLSGILANLFSPNRELFVENISNKFLNYGRSLRFRVSNN